MKQLMRKALLVSACMLAAPALMAKAANKTFFSARNEHQQGGRAWSMSAPHQMNKPCASRWGMSLDAHVFHSKSDNTAGLGEYFGAADKADLSDANGTVKVLASGTNALTDREVEHLNGGGTGMVGTLTLAPVQKRTGVHLGFGWDMSRAFKALKGWSLRVDAPIVQVVNNMGMTVAGDTPAGEIQKFFAGTFSTANQAALSHGRVDAADRKKTAVADVKVRAVYDFSTATDSAVKVHGGLIVPTGNHSTAVDMFEAVVGNNNHVGAALGGSGSLRLWKNEKKCSSLWLSGSAEYTFLFQAREKRVAGVYDVTNSKIAPWHHARVTAENAKAGVFPAANVLARDMYVTPGSHFDGTLGLTWACKRFHVNLGYNVYYRQSENVSLAGDWALDRYGFPELTYDETGASVGADFATNGMLQTRGITATHITDAGAALYQVDTAPATGADQETHNFVLGAGYSGSCRKCNYRITVGANYEFAAAESKSIDGWGVCGGLSLSF